MFIMLFCDRRPQASMENKQKVIVKTKYILQQTYPYNAR